MIPLFDLGNVIIQVDFRPFLQWLESRSKIKEADKIKALLSSSLFYEFEFGSLSRDGFYQRLKNHYQAEFSLQELEQQFCSIFPGIVPGMELLLEELSKKGPIYCLSNTNEIHLNHCLKHFELMKYFNRIFASHEMGKRKPSSDIYWQVARELEVPPSEIIFFDDLAANVSGASKAGLQAHVFLSSTQVRNSLQLSETE